MIEPPLDAPDEEWSVWSDAMQQAGDPRGALIALADHPEKLAGHVKRHADELLGRTLGRYLRKGDIAVTWRRARPDVVEVRIADPARGPQQLADVVAAPIAPLMRGIAIAGVPQHQVRGAAIRPIDLTETLGWFREMKIPRNWTSLALIDDRARAVTHMITRDFRPEPNLVVFGQLAGLWSALPQLEDLALVVADTGQIQFTTIALPELRSFALDCLYWEMGTGALLARAQWPKLTSLAVRLVEDFTINDPDDSTAYCPVFTHEPDGTDDPFASQPRDWSNDERASDLEALFASFAPLALDQLAVRSFANADLVLGLLERHPLHALAALDLSDSALDADALSRLANNPLMLQLRRLVLERIAAPSPKPLSGRGVEVVHSHAPRAPTYRYVVSWE